MMQGNEAFSRVIIDAQLKDQGWNTHDQNSVRFEYVLKNGRADYVLCDRHGRALAIIEAKRFFSNLLEAAEQAKTYAQALNIPCIFLANGQEILFWEWEVEAHPRPVKTFFKQVDLERRFATRQIPASPAAGTNTKPIASIPCAETSAKVSASCWWKWRPAPARRAPWWR